MSNDKEFKWTDELVLEFATRNLIPKYETNIEEFKKSKEPKPLFTTEDGKEIFEGDEYWCVENFEIWFGGAAGNASGGSQRIKYFSTEDKAKEYVLMNKPCLSINDFRSCTAHAERLEDNPHYLKLIALAQQKIADKT